MVNTLVITITKIVGSVISCSLVAYGFSRLNWPGREPLFVLVLATMMLPYAELFGLRKLTVRGTLWDAPAGIAYRATKSPTPAVSAFCTLVRTQFAGARQSQRRIADNVQG